MRLSPALTFALLGFAPILVACERDKQPDPFAVPGAMRMKIEYLTLPEAELRLKTLPEGQALAEIPDPCGQAGGPEGASVAWVRSELVKKGHDPKAFCDVLINPAASARQPGVEDTRTIEQIEADLIASRARLAMTNDNRLLTYQATETALKIINRTPTAAAKT